MESQPQNPEFRRNPENFTHGFQRTDLLNLDLSFFENTSNEANRLGSTLFSTLILASALEFQVLFSEKKTKTWNSVQSQTSL